MSELSHLDIALRGEGGRRLEFVLADEYEELTIVDIESDTLGDEPKWVVTLKRSTPGTTT